MCSKTCFAGEGSCGRKMTLETWVRAGESHDLIFNCFWRSRWGQNDERNSSITGRISGRRSKKKQWKKTDTGWEKACSDKGSDMDESEPGNAANDHRADSERRDIPPPMILFQSCLKFLRIISEVHKTLSSTLSRPQFCSVFIVQPGMFSAPWTLFLPRMKSGVVFFFLKG